MPHASRKKGQLIVIGGHEQKEKANAAPSSPK
jgi:hypothetical protein